MENLSEYKIFQSRYRCGEWRAKIFRDMVLQDIQNIGPSVVVLDIGCGGGFDDDHQIQRQLAECCQKYIGVEPDQSIERADYFGEYHGCMFEQADIDPNSIDIAFCVMVMEHLPDPNAFWQKLRSVMKPGGVFWGFTIDSRHSFCRASRWMERLRIKDRYLNSIHGTRGIDRYMNYPTYYRLNAPGDFKNLLNAGDQLDFINFSRVGQLDYYIPRLFRPVSSLIDRIAMLLNMPGHLCAVRVQLAVN